MGFKVVPYSVAQKRLMCWLMCFFVLAMLLAGCGGPETTDAGTAVESSYVTGPAVVAPQPLPLVDGLRVVEGEQQSDIFGDRVYHFDPKDGHYVHFLVSNDGGKLALKAEIPEDEKEAIAEVDKFVTISVEVTKCGIKTFKISKLPNFDQPMIVYYRIWQDDLPKG